MKIRITTEVQLPISQPEINKKINEFNRFIWHSFKTKETFPEYGKDDTKFIIYCEVEI